MKLRYAGEVTDVIYKSGKGQKSELDTFMLFDEENHLLYMKTIDEILELYDSGVEFKGITDTTIEHWRRTKDWRFGYIPIRLTSGTFFSHEHDYIVSFTLNEAFIYTKGYIFEISIVAGTLMCNGFALSNHIGFDFFVAYSVDEDCILYSRGSKYKFIGDTIYVIPRPRKIGVPSTYSQARRKAVLV